MLLSLIRMIQAFRDYQRNVNELSQLSDRELADIGLDRSDIPRVAAGTYQRLIVQPTDRTDSARLAAGVVVSGVACAFRRCAWRRKALTLRPMIATPSPTPST